MLNTESFHLAQNTSKHIHISIKFITRSNLGAVFGSESFDVRYSEFMNSSFEYFFCSISVKKSPATRVFYYDLICLSSLIFDLPFFMSISRSSFPFWWKYSLERLEAFTYVKRPTYSNMVPCRNPGWNLIIPIHPSSSQNPLGLSDLNSMV